MHWAYTLVIIASLWFLIYILGRYFRLDERFGWSLGPIFLLMRTKRFNKFLKHLASKHAKFWRFFGNISIFSGLLCMLASFGALIYSLVLTLSPSSPIQGPTVGIIIPGITISFKTALYLIIPIILTMIPHELAHGVIGQAEGVEIKSTGLAFFAIFFGAFVEPDEESMIKTSYKTRMRIFASGIFPNLIFGLLIIPVLIFTPNILSPFYYPPDGVLIKEVIPGAPAAETGLTRGVVIFDINATHIYTQHNFSVYMQQTKPNQIILLNTSEGLVTVRLGVNPNNDSIGYLGAYTIPYQIPKTKFAWQFFPYHFQQQILWLLIVSFGVVLFNALPIPFLLDGDKLLASVLQSTIKKDKIALVILDIFRFLAITLFLVTLIIPIVKFGFVPIG